MAAAAAGDDECHQVVNSFDADVAGDGQDLGMAVCQHHGGHDEAGGKDAEAECRVEVDLTEKLEELRMVEIELGKKTENLQVLKRGEFLWTNESDYFAGIVG